jgi:hypothetical protein
MDRMSSALTSQPAPPRPAAPAPMRFTRADYYRMAEAGIIEADARVELLDGEIYRMSPIGSPHGAVLSMLAQLLTTELKGRAICRVQLPVILDDHSEPEPDLAIVRSRADFYRSAHPGPADVLLLVEISDSSIKLDLGRKRALYAQAGIPEYWVFDLTRGVLVTNREPAGEAYASVREHNADAKVAPRAFEDVAVDLKPLLA